MDAVFLKLVSFPSSLIFSSLCGIYPARFSPKQLFFIYSGLSRVHGHRGVLARMLGEEMKQSEQEQQKAYEGMEQTDAD
ncbi:MAG: hypothetical protein AB7T38_17045 [Nitrospirales bacterium]